MAPSRRPSHGCFAWPLREMHPICARSSVKAPESRLGIVALAQMRWRVFDDQLERRSHDRIEHTATARRHVRPFDNHGRVDLAARATLAVSDRSSTGSSSSCRWNAFLPQSK